jgi:hypothetical protein
VCVADLPVCITDSSVSYWPVPAPVHPADDSSSCVLIDYVQTCRMLSDTLKRTGEFCPYLATGENGARLSLLFIRRAWGEGGRRAYQQGNGWRSERRMDSRVRAASSAPTSLHACIPVDSIRCERGETISLVFVSTYSVWRAARLVQIWFDVGLRRKNNAEDPSLYCTSTYVSPGFGRQAFSRGLVQWSDCRES